MPVTSFSLFLSITIKKAFKGATQTSYGMAWLFECSNHWANGNGQAVNEQMDTYRTQMVTIAFVTDAFVPKSFTHRDLNRW